ncbi:MAG: response regulator [Clostridiaceae bacterium]|nr:response regulator [Clostridiaceae bacterium]
MLKILIVDDEYYFREALKVSLRWKELGFEICGEAKNGKDALDKVEKLNPEIIIVDINMPIMDGLEFVQSIREADQNIKIIIITGYNEFNYAKQAIQLGVYDYILKPVDEEELKNSLLEIKKVIEKEENIKVEVDRLKQQVKDSLPLLKNKFLNELIQGNLIIKENETLKKMEYLNINIYSDYYMVATFEMDFEDKLGWNDEDKELWKFAVSNISNEILEKQFDFDICFDNDDRICIIIGKKEKEKPCNFELLLESNLELIRSAVYKHMGGTITIGVGNEKKELFSVSESYKESVVALKNKLILGKNKVILYSQIAESCIKENLFTVENRGRLLMNMRTADDKEVLGFITQIFNKIRRDNINYELLFVVCIEMISLCLEFIVEVGLSFNEILPKNQLNIIDEIQSKSSIDEMEDWIKDIYKYTLDAIKKSKNSKASKLIEEVKTYIKENYQNSDLSIDEIAKNLFVNYAHLCFIFRRDTGTTINDYLTEIRINKAKELFDGGNYLIHNVAGRVGYADANYFGKCFKKYYGLAPSKYLKNISK